MRNVIVSTYYCTDCVEPTKEFCKSKFNHDNLEEEFILNFSDYFDPFKTDKIPYVGKTKRKDLVYGKIFLLRKFFEERLLGKYDNVVHIDYMDTKFSRSSKELFEKFINSKEDIVISTEKNCWPYIETVSEWVGSKLPHKDFLYINSGAVIGKVDVFYDKLKKLERICLETNIDFWDDQGVWQYLNLTEGGITKDDKSQYFFSTALLDNTFFTRDSEGIKTKFKTFPFLIHDNSSYSLGLTHTI